MTRRYALFGIVLALALSAGIAVGKDPVSPPKPPKPPKPLVGTVVKIDGLKLIVHTRGKQSGEVPVTTDAKTQFMVKAKPATLADIKLGHEVVVIPPTGVAQKVVVPDMK